jgi:hypothetical protein
VTRPKKPKNQEGIIESMANERNAFVFEGKAKGLEQVPETPFASFKNEIDLGARFQTAFKRQLQLFFE